jgi:hypothetical protein
MKKTVILTAVGLLLFCGLPLFSQDQFELGIGFTPIVSEDKGYAAEEEREFDAMLGFHGAYAWWGIFYASWDAIAVPPPTVFEWTGYPGRAGFLNLFGGGIRLLFGPFALYSTVGINNLYVYRQNEDNLDLNTGFGANLRLGAGLRFGMWGANISGTVVFPGFADIVELFKDLADDRTRGRAVKTLRNNVVPSLNFVLYL